MYGMLTKALESMIREGHGEAMWLRIRAAAGVDVEVFVSNEPYPDDVTFRLAVAAAEALETPVAELLRAFGSFWVLKTARQGYGDMLAACGRTLPEFLTNLPSLHTRVGLIFPRLQPPEFQCVDVRPNSLRLLYRSSREGLTPFVVGLIEGLGVMFETPVTVTPVPEAHGPGRDEFLIEWPASPLEP